MAHEQHRANVPPWRAFDPSNAVALVVFPDQERHSLCRQLDLAVARILTLECFRAKWAPAHQVENGPPKGERQ
jgi:hypothetical protein